MIYAHRGASAAEPENSLTAFERAVADGADGVELDVRATADGVPVVLHDRGLARTTGGHGLIDELPLSVVRQIATGDRRPIPTLAKVLELLAGRLALDLEIKQAGVEAAVLATLAGFPAATWVLSSFDWSILRSVRSRAPEAVLWPLAQTADEALFDVAAAVGADGVALQAAAISEEVVERCRQARLRVMAWTVNDVGEARRLRELGVAVLCTDHPAEIREGLREGG